MLQQDYYIAAFLGFMLTMGAMNLSVESIEDGELADWLSGQGSYAASWLAELPGRTAFRARVEELTAATTTDSAFRLAGDRV